MTVACENCGRDWFEVIYSHTADAYVCLRCHLEAAKDAEAQESSP